MESNKENDEKQGYRFCDLSQLKHIFANKPHLKKPKYNWMYAFSIHSNEADSVTKPGNMLYPFVLKFKSRVLLLEANSKVERDRWMNALEYIVQLNGN